MAAAAGAEEQESRGSRMGIELVIFDCDGVLVDSEILCFEVEAEALAEFGIPVAPADLIERFLGVSSAAAFTILEKEHGVRLPPDFASRSRQRVLEAFDHKLRPIPGVAGLLQGLAHRRCVASSSDPAHIRRALSLTGLLHHFDPHLFSAAQVKRGKPAPDLFQLAPAQMRAAPDRCLVIEDSVAGVAAARAAGMAVLGFTGGSHCRDGHADKLRGAGADDVFATMTEIGRRLAQTP